MLTSKILLIIAMIMAVIGLCISFTGLRNAKRMMKRNDAVADFRLELLNMSAMYNVRHIKDPGFSVLDDACNWFFGKYTYEGMLYSEKPLTLEEWFTEEEIHKIKN